MTTRLEPVAWRVRANRNHPLVERDPFEWRLSETKPVLGEGAQVEWFDVQPLYAAAPAPEGMQEAVASVIRERAQVGGTDWTRFTLAGDINAEELADAILAIIAKGAGLVGFYPVSTTRTHSPAKMMGDVTRADFGPDGPEGGAYFEAYVRAISETPK